MDIGKSFGFVFEDKEWVTKILIGALILLAGVLLGIFVIPAILAGFLLSGYGVEITRRVIRREAEVLPVWDNWGDLLIDGLKVWVIGVVYALPIIISSICLGTPIGILSENSESAGAILSAILGCINLLWGIVMAFLLPAAIALFVDKDDLGAAFRFGEVFGLVRDNFSTYLITAVMIWVANLIGGLGVILCGFGWLVTYPYAVWVSAHLGGLAYLEATGRGPQPALEEEFV